MNTITDRFNQIQKRLQKRQQYYQQKQLQIDYAYNKNQHLTLEEKIRTKFRFKVPAQKNQQEKEDSQMYNIKKPKQQVLNSPITQQQEIWPESKEENITRSPQLQNNSNLPSAYNSITQYIESSLPDFNNYESLRFSSYNTDVPSQISNQKSFVELQNNFANTFRLTSDASIQQLPKNISEQQLKSNFSQQLQSITKSNTDQLPSVQSQTEPHVSQLQSNTIQLLSQNQLNGSLKIINQSHISGNPPSIIEKATSMTQHIKEDIQETNQLFNNGNVSTTITSTSTKQNDEESTAHTDESISLISIRRKRAQKQTEDETDVTIGYCTKQRIPVTKASQSFHSFQNPTQLQLFRFKTDYKSQVSQPTKQASVSFQENPLQNKSCMTVISEQKPVQSLIQKQQNNYSYSIFQKQKSLQQQYKEFLTEYEDDFKQPEIISSQHLYKILKDNIITKLNK